MMLRNGWAGVRRAGTDEMERGPEGDGSSQEGAGLVP